MRRIGVLLSYIEPDPQASILASNVSYWPTADVIVALGGDGLMLQTLHRTMKAPKPIYGMNRGSVGFLMNEYSERGLRERLAAAKPSIIHPLAMRARDVHGAETAARAINEVSLLRQTYQAAKLRIEGRSPGSGRGRRGSSRPARRARSGRSRSG